MKPIAMYARVSTARQEEEQTVQTQISALREYSERNGYTIVKEYIDEGWSGDTLIRPALDRLRQEARNKIWEAVLMYDPDRLARRYSYQELVMDELREAGVEIIFVTLPAPKNSEDKILHGVRGLFAEYERAKISERFRLGKLRKAKEGHIQVTVPLYGYNYIPKTEQRQGYYEINESEARVVRMIFSWVADERMTLRKVIRRLHKLGIKPRHSKKEVWSTSTLSTLMHHKGYIGKAHWGKSYGTVPENPLKAEHYKKQRKTSRKIRPETEWHIIPVPPIIDKELFMRARRQLDANYALCQKNKKNEYLLAGKIWCECGRRRAGEGVLNGKHLYYRCTDRVYSYPSPPNCIRKSLHSRVVDQLVWDEVAKLMSDPILMQKQMERIIRSKQNNMPLGAADVTILENEAKKLKKFEDRYNKAYASGLFSIEKLAEYLKPIRENLASIENQLGAIKTEDEAIKTINLPSMDEIDSYAQRARELLPHLNFQAKRVIVCDVIEKVIGTREKLTVYGNLPINKNVELLSNHRNGLNTTRQPLSAEKTCEVPFQIEITLPAK